MVSPNTAHWQQQINSSFEALVSGAFLSPHLVDGHHLADCSDWRYAVDDPRGVCPTVDRLQRKDWSLRHLEQRSDSRDSGLESDAAADRHHVCPAGKQPQVTCCEEDRRSLHAAFSRQSSEPFVANLLGMDAVTPSNSPARLRVSENYDLCGVLGKKKLHRALAVRPCGGVDEMTNGFASYQRTPDSSGTAVFQQRSSASLRDISRLHSSQSKCLTR